ncbi:Zinc finger protein like [Quillaja saponaria]|uniref:Zinc finger protein like n=1 Tax=Quillaja saponaria TaxID=32244 RepID=A0AAD7PPG7_QUISA|nr:Zinc finger protein like [Quillaja saponaria]
MNYSGYDYQQHQQHEQQQHPYDPSQIRSYDQSSQAYYGYNQQYNQHYPYYPSHDYTNSYAQQTYQQFQQEPSLIHPPGVPIPSQQSQTSGPGHTHMQNQQNVYYPPGVMENQLQLNPIPGSAAVGPLNPIPGSPAEGPLNPAANAVAAALSQLKQFAGNTGAVHKAMHSPASYRRGGRSGRPFRGGGRGRNGGRHFPPDSVGLSTPKAASVPSDGVVPSMPPPLVPGQAQLLPAQVPANPFCRPPHMACCEVCRVDCNTPEILEQHRNGKRHKKNLKVHEELQKLNKVRSGPETEQMSNSGFNPENVQPEKTEESKNKEYQPKNMASEVASCNYLDGKEQPTDVGGTSKVSAEEPDRKTGDHFAARGPSFKHKMRGGRGGKYMRANSRSRRLVEPPKPKQVIPLICELCNVKCESQVVFDSHLAGKKHVSNLKRFHGHQVLYGEEGLQACYPPNINSISNLITPQVQQGVTDPQVLLAQLLTYVLSQAQAPSMMTLPGPMATQVLVPTTAAGSSLEIPDQLSLQMQGTKNTEGGRKNLMMETKGESFVSGEKVADLPVENSIIPSTENQCAAD